MTALPLEVSWTPPAPGAFTRQFRLGEWIGEPVTPLFESWLLTVMEEGMHAWFVEQIGQRAPAPLHVVVNGWYFYSLNWASPAAMIGNLPRMLGHLVRHPRRLAGVMPATVRHSFPTVEREWRADFRPRYRAAILDAEAKVETLPVAELPPLIDELADLAGEGFGWLAALAGAAYKLEFNLAGFYRRHLRSTLGGSHLPLVTGFGTPPADMARTRSRRSTGSTRRPLHRPRRRRRAASPRGGAARGRGGRPSPRWPRRRAVWRPSVACSPTRSTSSRCASSRSAS